MLQHKPSLSRGGGGRLCWNNQSFRYNNTLRIYWLLRMASFVLLYIHPASTVQVELHPSPEPIFFWIWNVVVPKRTASIPFLHASENWNSLISNWRSQGLNRIDSDQFDKNVEMDQRRYRKMKRQQPRCITNIITRFY